MAGLTLSHNRNCPLVMGPCYAASLSPQPPPVRRLLCPWHPCPVAFAKLCDVRLFSTHPNPFAMRMSILNRLFLGTGGLSNQVQSRGPQAWETSSKTYNCSRLSLLYVLIQLTQTA